LKLRASDEHIKKGWRESACPFFLPLIPGKSAHLIAVCNDGFLRFLLLSH
jgi:hypothetical protein